MADEQLRLFIGIPLSEEVRGEVVKATEALALSVEDVRWVKPQNWHVTLKFLGDTPADKVPGILDVLNGISIYLPFEMEIYGVGAFSSLASARVVWVGAYDESGTVHKIYSEIELGMKELGFPREKRGYNPHITIGRSKKKPARLRVEIIDGIQCECRLPVEQVVLFKSELKRSGAEYSIVGSVCGASRDSA